MKNLVVKKSRNGDGVFANKHFKMGTQILQIRGRVTRYEKLNEIGGVIQDNSFRYGLNTYLILSQHSMANFFNHSCVPNAQITKAGGKLYLIAFGEIPKGGEIVFDYSTILAADDIWKMHCNCGEHNCRRLIQKYTRMPKRLQQYYLLSGLIPRYIQKFRIPKS